MSAFFVLEPFEQFLDRLGLVAGGLERRHQLERDAAFALIGTWRPVRHEQHRIFGHERGAGRFSKSPVVRRCSHGLEYGTGRA